MIAPVTRIDQRTFGPWAVVTGASSGIGKEFARQLAASGLNLVLVARRLSLLEELGNQLAHQFGVSYRAVGVDLTEPGFLDMVEAATADLDVGLLISNTGTGHPAAFLTTEAGDLLTPVQLNALAHLRLPHHFGRRLAQRERGGVLLVSALGAKEGLTYMASDGAAKAYALSLGEALHVEGLAVLNANRAIHIPGRLFRIMAALTPRSMMARMNGPCSPKPLPRNVSEQGLLT